MSDNTPDWITDLIATTVEWARYCGYGLMTDIGWIRVAAVSGADNQADYLT